MGLRQGSRSHHNKPLRQLSVGALTVLAAVIATATAAAAQATQPTAVQPPGEISTAISDILSWMAWGLIPVGVAAFLGIGLMTALEIGDSQTRSSMSRRFGRAAGGLIIGGSAAAITNIFV